MALREFDDERGRQWKVWEVHPTIVGRERSREVLLSLRPDMAEGWLAFEEENGEHRRLAPIPDVPNGWQNATLAELRMWCTIAAPARRVGRLIE